ncbi:MAG: arginine--tRNA ligase [Verrucomicrobia bacterium]|nr:arginine--tRNA ligase [Verrucomicrobiota bacterium]
MERAVQQAVAKVLPDADMSSVLVRPCPDPKFGDYQTNALMSLAKERKLNPCQLAADVLTQLNVSEWCEKVEIAGAGFLNFRLKVSALEQTLAAVARGGHLFFEKAAEPRTIVIDFSSPNVAKPMHVGHIRSTVLGDCLARTLRLLGHRVVTDNHIGDWGTQFGKLLLGWKGQLDRAALAADPIGEMERLYKSTNAACETDADLLERARQELVKLQNGDAENLVIWREMIELSQHQFDTLYGRLGVEFDFTLGESFYNPRLKQVVAELRERGIARESEGAICVFSDGSLPPKEDPFLKQQDGQWTPNPCLIQKSDGAANYATTDLATLAYRFETWQPAEIVYVTDGRQQLHFRQLFAIFRRWHPDAKVKLSHVWFGSILGENNTPFKTRSGETVKLAELLDEAESRALAIVSEKNPNLSETERREIARVIGLGAIKYADLSPNRQSDYVFSWDKMLSFAGNTAPYLQYAYARIRSIFRKAGAGMSPAAEIRLIATEEITLAKKLLHFGLVLEAVTEDYRPNYLCNYLYELAGVFTGFYEACPVLKAADAERASRLALCDLTSRVLQQGLALLGIETVEQM